MSNPPSSSVLQGALVALVLAASPAFAQERPWAQGVPAEKQKVALEHFREGNSALKESLFPKAAQKYREALREWDHPAIHYNMALALLNLDQPVEVHEHLLSALKYGALPLDADKYEQALRYKALTEKQLTRLVVSCEVAGAAVGLDGRTLFTAPGRYEGMVRAGPHSVVASREGYLTVEQSRTFAGGATEELKLELFRAEDLTQYRRLWPAWIPWTVTAAGAVVVGAAAAMHLSVRQSFAQYDSGITACTSAATGGCTPDLALAQKRQNAESLQPVAIGGYVLGGAALATGATLLYLNRLQPYQVKPGETSVDVTVAPVLLPDFAGATALVRF